MQICKEKASEKPNTIKHKRPQKRGTSCHILTKWQHKTRKVNSKTPK